MSVATGDQSVVGALPATAERERTRWQSFLRFCRRYPRIVGFGVFVTLLVAICLLAPVIAPYNPRETNTQGRLQGPSSAHWMGTDQLGRDIFARVVHGARYSLVIGLGATAIAVTAGLAIGLIAGNAGGTIDMVFMRVIDVLLAFPPLFMAMAVVAFLGTGTVNVLIEGGLAGTVVVQGQTIEGTVTTSDAVVSLSWFCGT